MNESGWGTRPEVYNVCLTSAEVLCRGASHSAKLVSDSILGVIPSAAVPRERDGVQIDAFAQTYICAGKIVTDVRCKLIYGAIDVAERKRVP